MQKNEISVYLSKYVLAQLSVVDCDVINADKDQSAEEIAVCEYFTKVTHDVKTRLEAAREIKFKGHLNIVIPVSYFK